MGCSGPHVFSPDCIIVNPCGKALSFLTDSQKPLIQQYSSDKVKHSIQKVTEGMLVSGGQD